MCILGHAEVQPSPCLLSSVDGEYRCRLVGSHRRCRFSVIFTWCPWFVCAINLGKVLVGQRSTRKIALETTMVRGSNGLGPSFGDEFLRATLKRSHGGSPWSCTRPASRVARNSRWNGHVWLPARFQLGPGHELDPSRGPQEAETCISHLKLRI